MRTAASAVLLALVLPSTAAAQQPFSFGGISVQPGTTASQLIQIPSVNGDGGTTLPISIVHGTKPGPVLALIAGVHGQEYTPILALQNLRASVDPRTMSGTIIMVHVANMPSYLARTIYYSPVDNKNLNRVFPGKRDGTISERIARVITGDVIDRATHVIDLHCGDGNESLRPYLYWITSGGKDVADAGLGMALAFGMDHIVVDRDRPVDAQASVYLSNTAITRGKPALTIESGGMGEIHTDDIARIERGVRGVMKHLGMTADGPDPVKTPVLLERSEVLRSSFTGIFHPMVEKGQTVAAGAVIGRVTDFFGKVLEEIKAPFAGEILYVVGTPAMNKGEPVGFIGATAR